MFLEANPTADKSQHDQTSVYARNPREAELQAIVADRLDTLVKGYEVRYSEGAHIAMALDDRGGKLFGCVRKTKAAALAAAKAGERTHLDAPWF